MADFNEVKENLKEELLRSQPLMDVDRSASRVQRRRTENAE